jgi:hypothetical protein
MGLRLVGLLTIGARGAPGNRVGWEEHRRAILTLSSTEYTKMPSSAVVWCLFNESASQDTADEQ